MSSVQARPASMWPQARPPSPFPRRAAPDSSLFLSRKGRPMPSMSTAIASCLRRATALAALGAVLTPSSLQAQARATTEQTHGRRLALVFGSNAYIVAPLRNPTRDAVGVDSQLRALSFDDVVLLLDADLATMRASIDNLVHRIAPG